MVSLLAEFWGHITYLAEFGIVSPKFTDSLLLWLLDFFVRGFFLPLFVFFDLLMEEQPAEPIPKVIEPAATHT